MESLSETSWDVVICGTGLQQALLALALSRSNKKILHIDPNEYYGGPDAALTLQEVSRWVDDHASSSDKDGIFKSASITKALESESLPSRAYSLSLSPQIIHARSALLSQLVSSRAYRQLEFLAVGSFFVYEPATEDGAKPSLTRIPSTREAVFSSSAIKPKAKRALMKFLKFVLDYEGEPQSELWKARADEPLESFLESEFKLDPALRAYVVTLTLSQSGKISVKDGLSIIHRHLNSMGVYGPGFAALYPKWGGTSEIAQVACRAGAVGGGVYMLGMGIKALRQVPAEENDGATLEIELDNDITVKARSLVRGCGEIPAAETTVSRLVTIIGSPLRSLFEAVVEGSPTPTVAAIAFPKGSLDGASDHPIYVMAHSSDTGECPSGQSILHLTTLSSPNSQQILSNALSAVIIALSTEGEESPKRLYQFSYEQSQSSPDLSIDGTIITLPSPRLDLAFDDASLDPIRETWDAVNRILGEGDPGDYMMFEDREGVDEDDEL
ncbi:hypothetical protein SAPIO_CDS10075 [Scedosporium apiospermum]|uniref:Rab proteins geranylgeranyltransferase n=1 Tax=Pseudallescheria apiosperma TaxID=563466 RepID=A0A084FWB2_PSEDA|nr:uncharacterized protein SAPIO_CDS10075 [Scedosporium apiospermum]KEZ39374.1 hypothetical protein SAPIO_CDS10075 [Scedosporium apiospermum]